MQQIVAMGGGGFSQEPKNLLLDQYVLRLAAGSHHPRVCFLAQASAESHDYQLKFYETFTTLGATPAVVSLFGRVSRDWQEQVLAQDVIYVGGGNTRSMLALWREWGMDQLLRRALEAGIVLAGVSAGACCWFDECITDSIFPMGRCDGLGFLRGSACPHYDSEPERRPTLAAFIESGEIGPGLALDDGAAAHFVDGELRHIVTSRPHANAYRIRSSRGQFVEELLPGRYLGAESAPDVLRNDSATRTAPWRSVYGDS